jgi:hypothetical protein
MQSNTKCLLRIRHTENSMQGNGPAMAIFHIIGSNLLLFGIAFVFSITLTAETRAFDQPDTGSYENLDTRWLPWIGSWRLVSNTVNTIERALEEEYLLTIGPGDSEESIIMKGYREETLLVEEKIIADGLRHPLSDDKCTGWYLYSWSETGKRLMFNSESNCPGDISRLISGMSIIDSAGDWLDIQLVQNGEGKAITIRRYRNVDKDSVTLSMINETQTSIFRISAGTNFSIGEIIELSSKVEPEVLEAALLEIRKPFPIDSKQLVHLADSGVPSRIVDLMVALSFPDKFTVEGPALYPVQQPEIQQGYPFFWLPYRYCFYAHPIFPWHWASSTCIPYGYSYLGFNVWPGSYYYFWSPPYYSGGGGHGGDTGRLVEGHGYTRVYPSNSGSSPRRARPRYAPAGQGASSQTTSSSSSGTSSSSYPSGSSSTSSAGSWSQSPSASPSGYSRGKGY